MESNPVKCFKYNHTIDGNNASCTHFSAILSISDDGEMLVIKTIRLNTKYNRPEFILEADRDYIRDRR